jgi:hypothetical protein
VAIGVHATQVLFRHTGVPPEHEVWVTQLPIPSHDWIALPRQRVSPGPQLPAQAPFTHVCIEQGAELVQVPLALHVCGVLPLH